MKRLILPLLLIFLILIFIIPQSLLSQEISVDLTIFLTSNASLSIHELLAAQLASASEAQQTLPLLFQAIITNHTTEIKTAILNFGIMRKSSTTADILLEGNSKPFDLLPGPTAPITNISILAGDSPYSLEDVDVGSAAEDLLSQILYTGNLPSGTYQFWVKILNPDGSERPDKPEDYEETYFGNPGGNLVLMSPGQNSEYPDIIEIYTNQPIFQWQSNSLLFEVFLYEEQDHNEGNPQSVINNEIYVEFKVDDANVSVDELNSAGFVKVVQLGVTPAVYLFQITYPSTARQLKTGLNYYWKVNALDGSGNIIKESEIWRFKYVDPSQQDVSKVENQQIMSLLRSLLGDAKFEQLFVNEGGEFVGYVFSGEMFDGDKTMDFNELHQIYIKFLSGLITLVPPIIE